MITLALCVLALAFLAVLIQFIFNPFGLGHEPDRALSDKFFQSWSEDLSSLQLLVDGEEAFGATLNAISAAKTSIFVQAFIWRKDDIGIKMAHALIEAGNRGVKISVKKDALGTFFELGDTFRGKLSPVFSDSDFKNHRNIDISVSLVADKDHSKYFLIDGRTVVFGGMNIGDEYYSDWHDYMVRIDSQRLAAAFGDKVLRSLPWPSEAPYFVATNDRRATEIRTAILQIIKHAKQRIILEHAYFSDDKVIETLKKAVSRGVQVDVILPKEPGTHLYANMSTINRLLESDRPEKLNIYLYPRMTHAKVALVDGVIAAVGSANLTPRSMLTTREVTLFAHGRYDDPFIKKLRDRLEADIAESERVTEAFRLNLIERARAVTGKYVW